MTVCLVGNLLTRNVVVQTYIGQSATCSIVHMVSYDILAFVKNSLICLCELIIHILYPCFPCGEDLTPIDITLTNIVVGINNVQVALQILGCEVYTTTDINI